MTELPRRIHNPVKRSQKESFLTGLTGVLGADDRRRGEVEGIRKPTKAPVFDLKRIIGLISGILDCPLFSFFYILPGNG